MALYSRGKYDDAVKALITAADLTPSILAVTLSSPKRTTARPIRPKMLFRDFGATRSFSPVMHWRPIITP